LVVTRVVPWVEQLLLFDCRLGLRDVPSPPRTDWTEDLRHESKGVALWCTIVPFPL
jgi:hypothetical protein